ncbi:exodeoxyribonuclease III [Novimethylophilus kurashikiensis]|uniref:Exodeoxyribonuclease III n=1 Tax=Novimethylophilus kurashikiensis TaxID=1825523 RepID=A0A2R5FAK5_9PROT|nr:exodeoxyribonuclease III [Novimethylophilus kurashikiensis]GBG13674.1 exodeoxyribonuclease III [Novimethylophilus kurashikiensis]
MKIAAWNVNSLKVRLPHVLDWLAANQPDALCLQETKQEDKDFPAQALKEAGYETLFSGQKTYNGVAILSKVAGADVQMGIPGFADEQKRVLAATIGDVRVVCVYVPNGQSVDSDKYQYKLQWLQALTEWLRGELVKYPRLALLGDYNIAPEDGDVHDPKAWEGQVLCSDAERAAYAGLIGLGMRDAFRLFPQEEKLFSWWDYRMAAFRRNMGLRIDHILLSDALAQHCTSCWIDTAPRKLERPSDHAPVIAEIACD